VPKYTDPKKAEQIMRAAGVIPLEPFKGSGVKWKCQCKKCKAIVYPAYNSVNSQKTNPCRNCAALEMGARRRKNAEKENIAIMKKAFLLPLESFPGNSKPWLSKCMKCKKKVYPHLSSVKNGSGCIYCAGRKVDENDVRAYFKKSGYIPIGPYPGAKKKWKAKHKPCGKVVYPEYSKVKQGRGCAVCSGNAKVFEPEAKKLFIKNHLKPLEPFQNSQTRWECECLKCGKIVSPTYTKVKARGHQCAYCAGSKVDPKDAERLVKSKGFKPLAPYPGGKKKWLCFCTNCKRQVEISYTSIKLGFGCKYCTGAAIHPDDAEASMMKRGYVTVGPYPGASKPWAVKCAVCKREQTVKMHSVRSSRRCVYCAGLKLDLVDVYKKLEEIDFKPLEKFKNATTPWKIKCLKCNHIIYPTWDHMNRDDRNRGCGYCSRVKVDLKDVNRLMKQLKLKPLVKYPGGKNPWKCKCLKCGNIVYPHYGDLTQGQGGCSNCADYGLNYTDKGYIYLITHPILNSHKIGIANSYKSRDLDDRMYKHKKQGWHLYKTKNFVKLRNAFLVEQEIIKWLRVEVGLPIFLSDNQMPQGGWTETVDASEIDLPTIWAKVEELSKVKR
jgi:hypothetical protein